MNDLIVKTWPHSLIRVCPRCGNELPMTVDHIIPQWLMKYTPLIGIHPNEVIGRAKLNKNDLKELVCLDCNHEKLGTIDWQDKFSRRYLRAFIDMMDEKYYKSVAPKKLFVVCKCKECEPKARVWSMGKIIQEPTAPKEVDIDVLMEDKPTEGELMPAWAIKKVERYQNKTT